MSAVALPRARGAHRSRRALVVILHRNPVYSALGAGRHARSCSPCFFLGLEAQIVGGAADHRLRRRDHRAVPVRDHAAQPAGGAERSGVPAPLAFVGRAGRRRARRWLVAGRRAAHAARRAHAGARRATAAPRRSAERSSPIYLLPFELTSMLLLVAIVGAVVLGRKRRRVDEPGAASPGIWR